MPLGSGFSSPAALKSAVKRLINLHLKQISFNGTETKTARELLTFFVDEAKEEATTSDFMYEEQKYGAAEEFETAPVEQPTKQVGRNQPRYYLVGRRRGPKEPTSMHDQSKLLAAVQGSGSARLEEEVSKWRQAGWKDWGEEDWTESALSFDEEELPLLQAKFVSLFVRANNPPSVASEIRTVLSQSHLISGVSIVTSTTSSHDALERGIARSKSVKCENTRLVLLAKKHTVAP